MVRDNSSIPNVPLCLICFVPCAVVSVGFDMSGHGIRNMEHHSMNNATSNSADKY